VGFGGTAGTCARGTAFGGSAHGKCTFPMLRRLHLP
jgi:hypothetical protein